MKHSILGMSVLAIVVTLACCSKNDAANDSQGNLVDQMGKTKYIYKGNEYTANQLVALFDHPKKGRKYSRRLGCWYITVDI